MADTSGVAALMKALNSTPGLGAGLKPSSIAKPANAAATSSLSKTSSVGGTSRTAGISSTAATAPRAVRASSTLNAGSAQKPKSLIADGQTYSAKAPRGSYVDLVV